jgi:hypothetical protein
MFPGSLKPTDGARLSRGLRHYPNRQTAAGRTPRRRAIHQFHPGDYNQGFELLETRQLLSSDLTQQIVSLLDNGTTTGSVTLNDVALGGFLSSSSVTVSFQDISQTGTNWSGNISVSAATASLAIGSSISAQINGASGSPGITGSYTLTDEPAGQGAYQLSASQIGLKVSGLLTAQASDIAIDYSPTAAAGQELAQLGSLSATLLPFDNANVTVDDLDIFDDGFTLGDATIPGPSMTLGQILTISQPSLTLSGVGYTGGEFTGTIGVNASSASLFPGQSDFTATALDPSGTYTVASQTLALAAGSFDLKAGNIFEATSTPTPNNTPALSFTLDDSQSPPAVTFDAENLTLKSADFPSATGTLTDLHADNTGFTIGTATLADTDPIRLGGVLSITGLSLGVENFSYTPGTLGASPTVGGTVIFSAESVSLFAGQSAFTSTISDPTGQSASGLAGSYDINTQVSTLQLDEVDIKVSDLLDVTADDVALNVAPGSFSMSVGSATASVPKLAGFQGSIQNLAITSDGFTIGSATLGFMGTIPIGSVLTISDPSATISGLSYSIASGAQFNGDVSFGLSASLNVGKVASASVSGLNVTLGLTPQDYGQFLVTANSASFTLGSYLTLTAASTPSTPLEFNTAATSGQEIVQFGTVTAQLTAGPLSVSATGQDFGIDSSGDFVALPGFGIKASAGVAGGIDAASALKWPTFLPIQVSSLSLTWPDFKDDPSNFSIEISAGIDTTLAGLTLSGNVQNAVFNVADVANDQFALTSITGAGFQVGGTFAGVTFDAEGFLATTTSSNGQSILYGGIDGEVAIAGLAGLQIRLGLSQLGPLDVYAMVDAPIILDPDTGLAITDLSAGINFGGGISAPDSAADLTKVATGAFSPTLSQWETDLAGDVANQVSSGASWTNPPKLLTIQGGATIFDAYASTDSFELTGNVAIDTTGKLLASGTVTMGGSIKVQGSVYIDLSQVKTGNAVLEMNVTAPADNPIVTAYGTVDFELDGPVFNSVQVPTGSSTPQLGDGLVLDGGTGYGSAPNINLNNTSFTVEFWAQRSQTGQEEYVIGQGPSSSTTALSIGFDTNNDFVVNSGGKTLSFPAGQDTSWHQWAVTFDMTSGTLSIYRDGVMVGSGVTAPIEGASETLLVGKSGSIFFDGGVDEARVWNVARTASQIETTLTQQALAPTAGLVADWSFNEGAGITAADSSGNGHTMTLMGGVTWAPTEISGASQLPSGPTTAETATALELDGTDAFASASGINLNNSSFTIELWARQNDTGRLEYVISQGDPPSSGGLQIGFDQNNNFFVSWGGSTLSTPTNDHSWHEWAVTFDATSGQLTIYRDGVPAASDTAAPIAIAGSVPAFLIGKAGSTYFDGDITQVRVWTVVRTETDINSDKLSSTPTSTIGLLAAWNFSEGMGTTAGDSSENSDSATISGGAQWISATLPTIPSPAFEGFTITITGGLDLTVPDVPGDILITGTASFRVDAAAGSLQLNVSGMADIDPIGNALDLEGYVHFDLGAEPYTDPTPEFYGIFALQTGQLFNTLSSVGLNVDGIAVLRFNTTSTTIPIDLPIPSSDPTQPAAIQSFEIQADSVSLMIQGDINFQLQGTQWFGLDGTFDAIFQDPNNEPELDVLLNASLIIGPPSAPVVEFDTTGFLRLWNAGLAAQFQINFDAQDSSTLQNAGINLNAPIMTPANQAVENQFEFELNTSGQAVNYTAPAVTSSDPKLTSDQSGLTINIPAGAPEPNGGTASAGAYMVVLGSGGFELDNTLSVIGMFEFEVDSTGLTLAVSAQAALGALGQADINGDLVILDGSSAGVYGILQAALASSPAVPDVSLSVNFQFEINTTSAPRQVTGFTVNQTTGQITTGQQLTLEPGEIQFDSGGDLTIDNLFDLAGQFDFTLSSSELDIDAQATLTNFFGQNLGLHAEIELFESDSQGSAGLVVNAGLSLSGSLAASVLTISASPQIEINTSNALRDGLPANTYEVELNNAKVNYLGLQASGTLDVGASNGVFEIDVPASDPLELGFSNLADASLSGYINSSGQFNLTGSVGFDLSQSGNGIWGSLQVTISNNGFSGNFSGGAEIFGCTVASVSGGLSINDGSIDLDASVSFLFFNFSFNIGIGQLNTTAGPKNSLLFYGVPTTALAGGTVALDATATDGNGNFATNNAYTWTIYDNNALYIQKSGNDASLQLGNPGTYTVVMTADAVSETSTIQVGDVAPNLSSLNLQQEYAAGQPVTLAPSVYSPLVGAPGNLNYQWTILKNGNAIATATTPTYTFTPSLPTVSQNGAVLPDVYQVSLTVSDNYGGKTTSSGSFGTYDPANIMVTTTGDTPEPGQLTLRQAIVAAEGSSGNHNVRFASDLAGQTITLTNVGDSTDQGNSAIAVSGPVVVLDATGAPGVTIAASGSMRLFYVPSGTTLELEYLNLADGHEDGTASGSYGGAIYAAGVVYASNCAFIDNKAIGDYGVAGGGAVYVGSTGYLSAVETTFGDNEVLSYNGQGGAIDTAGPVSLEQVTIADNSNFGANVAGAGVYDSQSQQSTSSGSAIAFLANVLIADNSGGLDFDNEGTAGGQINTALIGTSANLPSVDFLNISPTFLQNVNPLLGPLADHGDGVLTFSLMPGSPALNDGLGPYMSYMLDGRGYPFPVTGTDSIGAFQSQPYVVSDTNDSGPGSLRAAITEDDSDLPIFFAPNLAGQVISLSSGPITITHNLTIEGLGANALQVVSGTVAPTPSDLWSGNDTTSDSSGALPVSAVGAISYTSGIVGNAFQLTGHGDVSVPDSPTLDSSSFTIGGWFDVSQAGEFLASKYDGDYHGWILETNGADEPVFQINDSPTAVTTIAGTTALSPGSWYYLAASFDGANVDLYENGQLVAKGTLPGGYVPSATPLVIGGASWYTAYSTVDVEQFAFSRSALTANQIMATYDATLSRPQPAYQGSGILNIASGATVTITGLTLGDGDAASGGAIDNAGTLTLNGIQFIDDSAPAAPAQGQAGSAFGGAIDNASGGNLEVTDSAFINDAAVGGDGEDSGGTTGTGGNAYGGAIYNAAGGSLAAADDTFTGDVAAGGNGEGSSTATGTAGAGFGGAIFNAGSAGLVNVTIARNGVANGTGNAPSLLGDGGGLYNQAGGTLSLSNSIVADDTSGNLLIESQVVSANAAQHDLVNLGTASGSSNLVMTSTGLPASMIVSTADPDLAPLQNTGGTTSTLVPLPGSPVLGAGNPNVTGLTGPPLAVPPQSTDQRGDSRTVSGSIDLGAVESQPYVVTSTSDSGPGSLRQEIAYDTAGDQPVVFSSSLAGKTINLTSGPITIQNNLVIEGPGETELTISGGGTSQIFVISSGNVSISGLTLSGGVASQGGAIQNSGNLTITNCELSDNVARDNPSLDPKLDSAGGAIINLDGATLIVSGTTFAGNKAIGVATASNNANAYGGAIENAAGATFNGTNLTFDANSAVGGAGGGGFGGAIDNAGTATFVSSTIEENSIASGSPTPPQPSTGAGINNQAGGTLAISNSIVSYNTGAGDLASSGTVTGPDIVGLPVTNPAGSPITLTGIPSGASATSGAHVNNLWTISSGPGQQIIAGENLVFDGSDPIALPSGLVSAATALTVNVAFSTTGDGVILGDQDQPLGVSPGNFAPDLYVGTDGYLHGELSGFGTFQSSAPVNNGQTHDVVLSLSGSTMTVTIDGTRVAQVSGSNNALDMTFNQLGTSDAANSPDAPTSGEFPFTGTISSLTITQGTALAGYVAPVSASGNQITFTPPAPGTYTVGLSSTDSSGLTTSTSQTLAATDVAPSPTISGLPASGAANQTYTLVGSATDPVPSNTAAGFNDVWIASMGPGQQSVAASNLVFNGGNPITLPSGLISNATSLKVSVTFQTTGDGVIVGYQYQPLGSTTPGDYVPLLYIGTNGHLYFEFYNGSSKPIESATELNDGQLHTVTFQWNGSVLSYALDSKTSGTISGFTPEMLNMTYDELGSGYATGYPAAPAGAFPFTGTITSLTITTGTALQGALNPNPSANSRASFTPFTSGAYSIGLSSSDIEGDTGTISQSFSTVGTVPSPAIAGLPASSPEGTAVTLSGSATETSATVAAQGFSDLWQATDADGASATGSGALSFNGTSQFVDLGNPTDINFSGQITLDAWIMPESTSGLEDIIAHGYQTSPTNAEDFLRISSGEYQVGSWNGNNALAQVAIPTGDIGHWVNLAGVYNGSEWILYRDGVQVATSGATTQGALPVSSTDWTIGAGVNGSQRYFQGQIDDVGIWNVGLSASAVKSAMATGPTAAGSGLVAYYPFNETGGNTAIDATGNGNNGTLGGATSNNPPADPSRVAGIVLGPNLTITPGESGIETVTLEAFDAAGGSGEVTATFTSSPVPIIVNAGGNVMIEQGTLLTRTGSFTDLPGDGPWTATVSYGDGTAPQPLTINGRSFLLNHVFENAGTFVTTVTVTNRNGFSGSFSYTATVVGFTVNDGTPAPAPVTRLTYTFANPSLIDQHTFELLRDGKPTKVHLHIAPRPDEMTYVITFSGPGVIGGSLPDGHYTLITRHKKVKVLSGPRMASNDVNKFVSRSGDLRGGKKDHGPTSKRSEGPMAPPRKAPPKFAGRTVPSHLAAHRAPAPVRAEAASSVKFMDRTRITGILSLPSHHAGHSHES